MYVPDAVFEARETKRTRTLIDDPTPEIRREQEAIVIEGVTANPDLNPSDTEVLQTVVDGGRDLHSPKTLADKTGWSVRTIYRVLGRLSDILTNEAGSVRFASDYLANVVRDALRDAMNALSAENETSGCKSASNAFTRWKNPTESRSMTRIRHGWRSGLGGSYGISMTF